MSKLDGARNLTQSITINAAPEKVWDLITRIDTMTDWYDTWDRVETAASDTHMRAGVSFRLFRRRASHAEDVAQCFVTELCEFTRLQWEQSQPDNPTVLVTFELLPDATGDTTELRQDRSRATPTS